MLPSSPLSTHVQTDIGSPGSQRASVILLNLLSESLQIIAGGGFDGSIVGTSDGVGTSALFMSPRGLAYTPGGMSAVLVSDLSSFFH